MIPRLTKEQVIEIAEQLELGFNAYYHKTNGKLIFVHEMMDDYDEDSDFYEDAQKDVQEVENNIDDYIEIVKPYSRASFEFMLDFTDGINDDMVKNKLLNALDKKKPFREFKYIIDNSGEYRQQWFDFRSNKFREWVIDQFNEAIADLED